MVGGTPRLLQGPGTSREATRHLPRLLQAEGRFLGCLLNYRKDGGEYLCEIDVRPILGRDGTPQAFIAFEREVVRRRGRPSDGGTRRFRPAVVAATPPLGMAIPLFS